MAPKYNNTASEYGTHFLMGVPLIVDARATYQIFSENWVYPTAHKIGGTRDRYYAEVWHDGMDWSSNYWLIERINHGEPTVQPLMLFRRHEDEEAIPNWRFKDLVRALLAYRRDIFWIKSGNYSDYHDLVWTSLKRATEEAERPLVWPEARMLRLFSFRTKSSESFFYLNENSAPPSEVVAQGSVLP